MEQGKQRINILMVAFAAQGHINPMLRLGKHIQSKGNNIHVTLATTETCRHRLLKQNNHATVNNSTNSISGIDFEYFPDGFSLDYDRKSNLDTFMDTLAKVGPINLYNLIMSLGSNQATPKKFSCIITNPFLPWVADVATRVGIPCAMLWIQPCTIFAIYYSFYNNLNDFPTEENPQMSVELPGLPLLDTCDLPSFVLPSNTIMGINNTLSQSMKIVHNTRWVLLNSFYELEKDVIDHMSNNVVVKAVGPLVTPTILLGEELNNSQDDQVGINFWKSEDKCIDWLDQNKPNSVIYVSFGSLIVLTKEQMEIIGKALINCKRPFLWVVKQHDYSPDAGVQKVHTNFVDETKEQGTVVPWCPQDKVLSHKSVGCFLTHCGWNSMLETISAGVPIIAYPMWTDQPTNAKLVAEICGLGLRVWPDKDGLVSVEVMVNCIEEVLDGPRAAEIRAKAVEWKHIARGAVALGGSSDMNVQAFVDDIVELSSQDNNVPP